MKADPNEPDNLTGISCPSCLAIIDADENFCPKCGAPISSLSTLDPLHTIRTEGYLLGKATEGKPKPIVLIGVWIMFFPALIASAVGAISIIIEGVGSGTSGFIFFAAGVSLAFAFGAILFKVTRNYFKSAASRKEKDPED